ncbi:TonB-dependent receptor [Sphingobium sp. EM0848]|uniref:TonB-dependent receptor n=1 Tax=Sphingobium sp. EM0848 TaxID=2743473 RepID=UPI00159C384B|nr:TonB-dependent receptor [Sphingobium sp. EM0848]
MKYSAILLASVALTSAAQAQESKDESQGQSLQEIIVTAQKRSESLQDTPISIVALDSAALESKRIASLTDIASGVPNLQLSPHPNSSVSVRPIIRGVGELSNVVTRDSPNAIYVDGVYVGRTQGLGTDLAELERIEVLRGPQGTLYGRNATGGAISFITKAPELGETWIKQDLGIGNFDQFRARTIVNLGFGDKAAFQISYLKNQKDGFVRNLGTGSSRFGDIDRDAVRAALLWKPTDALEVRYTYDSAWINDTSPFIQMVPLYPGEVQRVRQSNAAVRNFQPNDTQVQGHNLTLSWDVGDDLTVKSITGYRRLNSFEYQDYHSGVLGAFPIFTVSDRVNQEQFTQELQLIGSAFDKRLKYVAGLYYFTENGDGFNRSVTPGGGSTSAVEFDNKAYAVFGQATYTPAILDDRLHITAGARWSKDKRDATLVKTNFAGTAPGVVVINNRGRRSFDDFAPTLTLAFDINRDVNIYAKVAKGYKTGGFNPSASSAATFARGFGPETLVSYEMGLKSEFFDRRVRFNLAAFYNDYKDIQLNVLDPVNPRVNDVLNAGKARIQGLEADISARVFRGMTLSASYGYVDPKYKKVVDFNGNDVTSAFHFTNAPKNSFTLAADYASPLTPIGKFDANVNYAWQDRYFAIANDPRYIVRSNGLLGARLGLSEIPGLKDVKLAVWGRNLTNRSYYAASFPAGVPSAIFGEPRTYGLDVSVKF